MIVLSAIICTFCFHLLAARVATYNYSLLIAFWSTFLDLRVLFEIFYFLKPSLLYLRAGK